MIKSKIENLFLLFISKQLLIFLEFYTWKAKCEQESLSNYVIDTGKKQLKTNPGVAQYLYCNRFGEPVSQSKGVYAPKKAGSRKCTQSCPAYIRVVTHPTGKVEAEFCSTHLGHERTKVDHMSLTDEHQQQLRDELIVCDYNKKRVLNKYRQLRFVNGYRPLIPALYNKLKLTCIFFSQG